MPLPSLSTLPDAARTTVAAALNKSLGDGLALYCDLKTAHWNSKGPSFIALHKFFDKLADLTLERVDTLAERIIGLGVPTLGTPRYVVASGAAVYPDVFLDALDHVRKVLGVYLVFHSGLVKTRAVADSVHDRETAQLLDQMIAEIEHDAALLRPHIDQVPPSQAP